MHQGEQINTVLEAEKLIRELSEKQVENLFLRIHMENSDVYAQAMLDSIDKKFIG